MSQEEVNVLHLIELRRQESKEEHRLLHERISNMKDELLKEMKEIRKDQEYINRQMEHRVSALERWKWTVVGAAVVTIFFVTGGIESIQNFFAG